MERRFAARRDQRLADAEVDPRIARGVLARREPVLDPFVALLQRSEQGGHARTYAAGLLSDLQYQNVASIASLHDQERDPLQQFLGQSPWDQPAGRVADTERPHVPGLRRPALPERRFAP